MVEEKLSLIQRPVDWTQADEAQAYERCLKEALEENGRAWADGNIRVGDYILLSTRSRMNGSPRVTWNSYPHQLLTDFS